MTTLEQAARQALELLEQHLTHHERGCVYLDPAVTALRQALEQQPKQEPVLWMYNWQNDGLTVTDWVTSDKGEAYAKAHTNIRPLYTAPPKREWVGMTECEAADCWSTSAVKSWKNIEAALKTKNT